MPNRILITGSGMVACALAYFAPRYGFTVTMAGRDQLNITDKAEVRAFLREARPDIVMHTSALTRVNYCQDNPQEAVAVNQEATAYIMSSAEQLMAQVIYFSTDYVFDGVGDRPLTEDDAPNPVNVYGMTKYAGEQITKRYHRGHVVRTSGVFGPRLDGKNEHNFVRAIAGKLLQEQGDIRVVADQYTCITYAGHLASMVFSLQMDGMPPVVHLTSGGKDSWLGWARAISEILQTDSGRLSPVSSEEYDPHVPRPAYSALGTRYPNVSAMISMHPATIGLKEYLGWLDRSGAFGTESGGGRHNA